MSVLAAIAIFPVLTGLLIALTKCENLLIEKPVPLQVVTGGVADVLNDAPTGDALPVPRPQLQLVHDDLAA